MIYEHSQTDMENEEIITGPSKFAGLAVIARHSSFRYKNNSVDTTETAAQFVRNHEITRFSRYYCNR